MSFINFINLRSVFMDLLGFNSSKFGFNWDLARVKLGFNSS